MGRGRLEYAAVWKMLLQNSDRETGLLRAFRTQFPCWPDRLLVVNSVVADMLQIYAEVYADDLRMNHMNWCLKDPELDGIKWE
jgi:hypothetical protein